MLIIPDQIKLLTDPGKFLHELLLRMSLNETEADTSPIRKSDKIWLQLQPIAVSLTEQSLTKFHFGRNTAASGVRPPPLILSVRMHFRFWQRRNGIREAIGIKDFNISVNAMGF